MNVFDNFLENYDSLKDYSLTCKFEDIENDIDSVVYPDICKDIPEAIKNEVFDKLSQVKGKRISNPILFMRMSKEGVRVPNVAHTDSSMGKYSMMLYLNSNKDSGTTFLRHIDTGIAFSPSNESFLGILKEDSNNLSAWGRYDRVVSLENRALVFDSDRVHCAEPVGGFGDKQINSRIVLSCFYD